MDTIQHSPIAGATIRLQGSDGSDITVQTDTLGYYVIDSRKFHSNVNYYINARAPKYFQSEKRFIQGLPGVIDTVTKNFQLHRRYFVLDGGPDDHFPMVLFARDSYTLSNCAKDTALSIMQRILHNNPTLVIEADGHADEKGGNKYNMSLSYLRSKACVDYLISLGIDSGRIIPRGWGNTRLLIPKKEIRQAKNQAQKDTLEQFNRRVVFQVKSWNYHPLANKK